MNKNRLIIIYLGHRLGVSCVDWSPDGRWLVSGGRDAVAQVWESQTGRLQTTFHEHDIALLNVAWSPDGRVIASGGYDDVAIYVWEAMSGKIVQEYKGSIDRPYDDLLAWSPDSKYLATGSDEHAVCIWSTTDQQCIARYPAAHGGEHGAGAWSPDSRQIAIAEDGTVSVWDFVSGDLVWQAVTDKKSVTNLAYSPDGRFLASCGYDASVQVRESKTGNLVTVYRGHPSKHYTIEDQGQTFHYDSTVVWSLAWSPDSYYLASASGNNLRGMADDLRLTIDIHSDDDAVQIWGAATGQHVYTYRGHDGEVTAVAWSPDGLHLASASLDGTVHVWKAP